MKTAGVYIRVSTDEQTEHSPESQLQELKKYAASHDFLIDPSHIYVDAGVSGRKAAKRPEFQKMIAAAKNKPRPFDVILVWKFSRFARNQEESILYKSLLRREYGVEVISITEETSDSMFGSLIERIIEWMDEFYSVRLGQEVRTKMTFVAEKGLPQTVAPFGYSKRPGEGLKIVPEEAAWVRFMAENLLYGKSLRWIANCLNERGVRTHRGNRFEPRTIEYILRNITNVGAVHWTPNQDEHDGRRPYSQNTIIVKDACPAIFSFDYYENIIAELDRRADSHKKYAKSDTVKKHWLSGFLKCSNCGGGMVYSNANNGFQCYKYGKALCDVSHFVSAPKIEAAIIQSLENLTITKQFIESITQPPAVKNETYKKDIDRLEKMLQRAKAAYVEGIDSLDEYAANKKRITAEIELFKDKIAEQGDGITYRTEEEVINQFDSVKELLKTSDDNDAKRQAFGSIATEAIYYKKDNSVSIFFYL